MASSIAINFQRGIRVFCVSLVAGLLPVDACWADTAHLISGKVVTGKLDNVTGDVIEFRENNSFGNKMGFYRIQLTNRHDIVETRGKRRYFGEVIYQDKFKLELKTANGNVRLNRLKITNVILGTPVTQPTVLPEAAPAALTPAVKPL